MVGDEMSVAVDNTDGPRAGVGFDRPGKVERTKMVIGIHEGNRKMYDLTIAGLKGLINGMAEGVDHLYARQKNDHEARSMVRSSVRDGVDSVHSDDIYSRGDENVKFVNGSNDSMAVGHTCETLSVESGSLSKFYDGPPNMSSRGSDANNSLTIHKRVGYISYRDCKQIFTDGILVPSIEVRRHCILICIPPVISFVFHDGIYILPNDLLRGDNLMAKVTDLSMKCRRRYEANGGYGGKTKNSSKQTSGSNADLPFEFNALECIVQCACEHMQSDILELEKKTKDLSLLVNKKNTSSMHCMQLLYALKNPVTAIQSKVSAISTVLEDLFESPQDLIHMNLSLFARNPPLYSHPDSLEVNPEIEMLLEYFDQEIDQMKERTRQIKESADNFEKLIELRLSLNRNKLIKLELTVTIAATVLAMSNAACGVYGMNLENGWENTPGSLGLFRWISIITYLSILISLVGPILIWRLMPL